MKKRETQYSQNKMFKENTKKLRKHGREEYGEQRTSLYGRNKDLLEVTTGRRKTS
jgi:hypothetical protein